MGRHFDPVCVGMHACCEKALYGYFYSKKESQLVCFFGQVSSTHFCRLFLRLFTENRGWTLPALFSESERPIFRRRFSNHLQSQIPSTDYFFFGRPITDTTIRRVSAWKNQLGSLPKHLENV